MSVVARRRIGSKQHGAIKIAANSMGNIPMLPALLDQIPPEEVVRSPAAT